MADKIEENARFYFVVLSNLNYGIVSGFTFEKWMQDNYLIGATFLSTEKPGKDKKAAFACFEHHIALIEKN